jgi:hypothetical protein
MKTHKHQWLLNPLPLSAIPPDTVGEPLFWFLITQRRVLKGGDEGAYSVIGGYEGSSCLWHETDEGFAINLLQKPFL